MPVNKIAQIVLGGDPIVAGPWVLGDEDTISAGQMIHLSTGANTTVSQPTIALNEDDTYLLTITAVDASFATGYEAFQLGGGPELRVNTNLANVTYPIVCGSSPASGLEKTSISQTSGDTIKYDKIAVTIQQFTPSTNIAQTLLSGTDGVTPSVRGEYVQSGTLNGQPAYLFGTAYNLTWDGSTDWQIRTGATPGAGDLEFSRTNASQLGDYVAEAGSTGTVTLNYGPTDHSEETGSAGLETSGSAPSSIDCKFPWKYLDGLSTGEFGIISVFDMSLDNQINASMLSFSNSDTPNQAVRMSSATPTLSYVWLGTSNISLNCNIDYELGFLSLTHDGSDMYMKWRIDASNTDAYSDLIAVNTTKLVLGKRAFESGDLKYATSKFGFTAILDYSAVTPPTTWTAWHDGLSAAINAVTSYDPHAIAAAIFAYDNNITGVYYALNELSSGDASSYYLLAYDITDSSAKTSEFYGLVSTSGVTGTVLVADEATGGGRYSNPSGYISRRYNSPGGYITSRR